MATNTLPDLLMNQIPSNCEALASNLCEDLAEKEKGEWMRASADPAFLNQCGLYILIDQLLTQAENSSDRTRCKKFGMIAIQLLNSHAKGKIHINLPESLNPQKYIESVMRKAEKLSKNNAGGYLPLFQKAQALTALSECRHAEMVSLEKFVSAWVDFARETFRARIKGLNEKLYR